MPILAHFELPDGNLTLVKGLLTQGGPWDDKEKDFSLKQLNTTNYFIFALTVGVYSS